MAPFDRHESTHIFEARVVQPPRLSSRGAVAAHRLPRIGGGFSAMLMRRKHGEARDSRPLTLSCDRWRWRRRLRSIAATPRQLQRLRCNASATLPQTQNRLVAANICHRIRVDKCALVTV